LNGALALGTFAVTFAPQALAYIALNGRVGPSHLVSRKMTWWAPHALQVLLSPDHGFLFWTPLAVLALAGTILLAVTGGSGRRRLGVCIVAMIVAEIYISGAVGSWAVAGAFGQRRFVGLTVLLVIGLTALVRAIPSSWARAAAAAAVALCVWWNVALIVQFGSGLMDRQHLDVPHNAYEAFVDVPTRLPDLAWRYLFDRASFYRPAGRSGP
jgi:hypothetical protein